MITHIMEQGFLDLGIVIIASSILGVLGYFLKQPLILAYIAAGIILGPSFTGLLHDIHFVETISHIGVVLMLFLIGLEMSTSRLKDLGVVALFVGVGQVVFTTLVGYGLASLFGFAGLEAWYIALALAFSSTVIAVKLLSEKRDISSYYGSMVVGILIIQDILAIIALTVLSGFGADGSGFDPMQFVSLFAGGALLIVTTMAFAKNVLSYLYSHIADSQELMILFSLAWCFIVAILANQLGFSMEIGAFIAGLNLANLPYTFEINAKAKLLRDFFITIFFVALGAGMVFTSVDTVLVPAILFTLFIVIGNPIIVMIIMGILGVDKRNGFYTGVSIACMSEFSLILLAMGFSLNHVGGEVVSMLTIVTIASMVLSSYMITYNTKLFALLKKPLSIFEFRKKKKKAMPTKGMRDHIILLGYGDTGKQILKQIQTFKDEYVVVDHDNNEIKQCLENDIPCVFGDVEDDELLDELGLEFTEIIISTLPHAEDNYYIFKKVKELPAASRPVVITVADTGKKGLEQFVSGADYVIVKSYLGASQVYALNKELYGLEDNDLLLRSLEDTENPTMDRFAKDIDYATFLENLNAIRLKELTGKFARKQKPNKKTSRKKK